MVLIDFAALKKIGLLWWCDRHQRLHPDWTDPQCTRRCTSCRCEHR